MSTSLPSSSGETTVASSDGIDHDGGLTSGSTNMDEASTTSGSTEEGLGDSGSTSSGGTDTDDGTGPPADCHPLLAEVLHDAAGANNDKQWVRLYNPCDAEIELTDGYSLGWGGEDYTLGQVDLDGTIGPGACWVVGGPESNNDNANPIYDQTFDFTPDMQSGGIPADGMALFLGTVPDVMADTVPVDAVIYGDVNESGLLDAEGNVPEPHVGNVTAAQSIRRTALATAWEVAASPTPNECPVL
jgi:hypothetical protein